MRYRIATLGILLCLINARPADADLIGPPAASNVFSLGGLGGTGVNIQGPTVLGGDGTFRAGNLGSIYAQGNLSVVAVNAASVLYGGNFNPQASHIGSANRITAPLYDFDALRSSLTAASDLVAAQTDNGIVTGDLQGNLTLTGTDPNLNVFTISPPGVNAWLRLVVPAGSMAFINVEGQAIDLTLTLLNGVSPKIGGPPPTDVFDPTHVLFNFAEATYLSMASTTVYGTILAPRASTSVTTFTQHGTLIAGDLSILSGRFFQESFDDVRAAAILPEPASLNLAGASLGALGIVRFFRRRIRRRRVPLRATAPGTEKTGIVPFWFIVFADPRR
ncbi:MAG: choice-of-anchor A family protein [Isosphaeraceae bacterium]